MEYEEDDDISFARWMSSFWGHSLIDENEKESRGHKKRQTRSLSERRASLPVRAACSFLCSCVCGLCIISVQTSQKLTLEIRWDENASLTLSTRFSSYWQKLLLKLSSLQKPQRSLG